MQNVIKLRHIHLTHGEWFMVLANVIYINSVYNVNPVLNAMQTMIGF